MAATKRNANRNLPTFDLPQNRLYSMVGCITGFEEHEKSYTVCLDGKPMYKVPRFIVDGSPERELPDGTVLPPFLGVRQFEGYDVRLAFVQKRRSKDDEVRWQVSLPDGIPGQAPAGTILVRVG